MAKEHFRRGTTRRGFLQASGAAALTTSVFGSGIGSARAQTRPATSPAMATGTARNGLNILFVFTDQERYHARWPAGLSLPGHERLERSGVTFTNHQCPATMCTSSRSVIVTGCRRPTTACSRISTCRGCATCRSDHPTIGQMLRKAGYYTAYKGKWHLSREFDTVRSSSS